MLMQTSLPLSISSFFSSSSSSFFILIVVLQGFLFFSPLHVVLRLRLRLRWCRRRMSLSYFIRSSYRWKNRQRLVNARLRKRRRKRERKKENTHPSAIRWSSNVKNEQISDEDCKKKCFLLPDIYGKKTHHNY